MIFLLNFLFSKYPLFPHIFVLNSPSSNPRALPPFLLLGGTLSSSRPLIKVHAVPGSNPPGSLMDIHTSENAGEKLLKWNAIPAVAITHRSDFLAETPGSSATAY